MIQDFQSSAYRQWYKVKQLLQTCEIFMWKNARRAVGKKIVMGKDAGIEFPDSIFGFDDEVERTENVMTDIRVGEFRFEVNCTDLSYA